MTAPLVPGPRLRLGLVLVAPAVLMAACGSTGSYGASGSSSTTAAAATSASTVEAHHGNLGTFLTDGAGRTLYLFDADHGTTSNCGGTCAAAWPPLTTKGSPKAAGQAQAAMLGTTNRGGGVRQVTYGGHPLYYYAGDQGAGDTGGQGIDGYGAKWWVVAPSGAAIHQANGGSSYSRGGY